MKKNEEEKRLEEITDHLKIIITWAAVGKDPKYYGIEQKYWTGKKDEREEGKKA